MKKHLILITVSGQDGPGITTNIMQAFSAHAVKLKDMGQAVTHGLLSLSFLIETKEPDNLLKDLLFITKKINLHLDFTPFTLSTNKSLGQKNESLILSCVSRLDLTPYFLKEMTSILAKHHINILRIDNTDHKHLRSLEIYAVTNRKFPEKKVKEALFLLSHTHQVDIALMKDNMFKSSKRLVVFDMDSTLIQGEIIDEMAKRKGVEKEIAAITSLAMNGKMDFATSLKKRMQKLQGLSTKDLISIRKKIKLTEGTLPFIKTLQKLGFKTAVISGGFSFFTDHLKKELKLNYAFANHLEIKNNKLTGKVLSPILDAKKKATILKQIAKKENISLEQVVAIGDGANDIPMLNTAGLGIAFHAKETVKKNSPYHMGHGPMTSILYFLGIKNTR